MWWLVVVVLVGCGRFGFEPRPAETDGDAAVDTPDAAPCPVMAGCADGESFRCPSGTCYAVCRTPADQPTQQLACEAAGAQLAVILDAATDACLDAHLSPTPTWYWIGLTQSASAAVPTEGWAWGTGAPYAYTNWYPGGNPPANPDDFDGIEDGFEQCAWKNGPPIAQWEDASCDNPNPGVICQW